MKKILALAVGMLLIPFTAFGMEAMSDGDMDSITGQSGVAISLSNVQIYNDAGGDEFWYETTVLNTGSSQSVGIISEGSASYMFINAIADPSALFAENLPGTGPGEGGTVYQEALTDGLSSAGGNLMLRGNYQPLYDLFPTAADRTDLGLREDAAVLSIRVVDEVNSVFAGKAVDSTFDGTEASLAAGDANQNFAAIEIGLPTLEIYTAAGSQDVLQIFVTGSYDAADGPVQGFTLTDQDVTGVDNSYTYSLGTIYTTEAGSTTAILGGRIGITSYGQIGEDYKTYGFAD